MDNWESLIAARMRPCASMPRHVDPTKERKRRARNRYYASEKGKENRKASREYLFGKKVKVLGIRRLTPTECSRLQTIPTCCKTTLQTP